MENWKDVPGYEGLYQVSDLGRVKSARRKGSPGGLVKPVKRPDGRLRVALSKQGRVTDFLVHRLVLTAFVGHCPEGKECLHYDDNPENNRLENLRWGTSKENKADGRRNGISFASQRNFELCGRGLHSWVPENIDIAGRCKLCRRERARLWRNQGLPEGSPLHGDRRGYKRGCRCDLCLDAGRSYQREVEKNRARRRNGVQ